MYCFRKLVIAAIVLLMGIFILAGPNSYAGKNNDTLNWGLQAELETLDANRSAKLITHAVIRNIHGHLLYRDPETMEIKPDLATSYKWVDNTTLEFKLREGVRFHNGEAFNADDVVYTIKYIKDPANTISLGNSLYGYIKTAAKVSDYVVRIELKSPTPSALDRLTQAPFILPNETHQKMGADKFSFAPVGTGPYKIESFEPGVKAVLIKNESYYDSAWGKPTIGKIIVWPILDVQTRSAELMAGKLDVLWGIPREQMEMLAQVPGIETASGMTSGVNFISFDSAGRSGKNPLQSLAVRRAICHAINRKVIMETYMGGATKVIHSPCHPGQFGCTEDVHRYDYDPAKAKKLLAEAGYANGFEMPIAAFGQPLDAMAEAISGDLAKVGIKSQVDVRETTAWIKAFFAGQLPMSLVPWPSSGVFDASAMVPLFFQHNQGDYILDDEIKAWFDEAAGIVDPEKRKALYAKGFKKIAENALAFPLGTTVEYYAFKDYVRFVIPQDGYAQFFRTSWK